MMIQAINTRRFGRRGVIGVYGGLVELNGRIDENAVDRIGTVRSSAIAVRHEMRRVEMRRRLLLGWMK